MDKARYTAAQALTHQEKNGYANLVLAAALEKQDLSPRDKAFVSAVFYGVCERLLTLDFCLQRYVSKPLEKLDAPVRAVLRSGLYQAMYMQIPTAVAVNESVALCKALKKTSAGSFVNAVLRKAVRVDVTAHDFASQTERLSVLYSVGQPIVALLLQQYPTECEAILAASFAKPATEIRPNALKTTQEQLQQTLQQQGVQTQTGFVPGALLAQFQGSPAATKAFREGLYHVQGQASQFAALCLGAQPGQKVVDVCAAPGGKTLTLGYQMQGKGTLIACDAAQNRLSLIETAAARCGLANLTVLHNDASQYNEQLAGADCVLCDVPCSGLGILAKKPDIRYKPMQDVQSLHRLQAEILATSARYVNRGGRLVYSTCTIDPRENQAIVQNFLENHSDFRLIPAFMRPDGVKNDAEMLTFLPGMAGFDGFFVATMERL